MFPLVDSIELSQAVTLGIALLLGVGFGFSLERAGFGSARKLTAVFYLYDMAVTKVMFTAVVTAMAGLVILSSAGLLDLAALYVEPTHFVGAAIGGLVFGAGFVIGGYCPGTSIAGCATGRIDALVFAAGLLAGVYAFAELLPGFDTWLSETATEDMTLMSVTGLSMGWFLLAFIGILALAAWGIRNAERRFAGLRPKG